MEITGKRVAAWIVALIAGGTALFGLFWGLLFVVSSPIAGIVIWLASGIMFVAAVLTVPYVREKLGGRIGVDLSGVKGGSVVALVIVVSVGLFTGGFLGGLMAVPTDTSSPAPADPGPSADANTQTTQTTQTTRTTRTTTTATAEPEPSFGVRIDYTGAWQGAISITGGGSSQTESISGRGTQTIDITGDVSIISANAQKQDGGTGRLTIQILQDGEVVAEADTTSEYGVAQVSQSFY